MRRSVVSGFALMALAAPAVAQRASERPQVPVSTSSHRPISPTVLASWYTRDGRLTLLALWRGSPGWFWRADGGGGGGGGGGEQAFQQIREGGLTFTIDYDFRSGIATVAGSEISLINTNVVMLDYVDSLAGPAIVGTRHLDPELSESRDVASVIIRREPDLYRFLQCDSSLPPSSDPAAPMREAMVAALCAQMRPQ